jgi:hypothetical protein
LGQGHQKRKTGSGFQSQPRLLGRSNAEATLGRNETPSREAHKKRPREMMTKDGDLYDAILVPPASLSDMGKKLWNQTVLDPDFVGFGPTVTRELLRSFCAFSEALKNLEFNTAQNKSRLPADEQQQAGDVLDRLFGPRHQELAEIKSRLFKPK